MYGALSKLEKVCEKGDWVVIMGAGGGLGHLLVLLPLLLWWMADEVGVFKLVRRWGIG